MNPRHESSPALPANARSALAAWLRRSPGAQVLAAESERCAALVDRLFGLHALQIGLTADCDLLAASRVPWRARVALPGDPRGVPDTTVEARANALPVDTDSVDLVLLPHVLEFESDPHAALREVQRVLVPEGHVIVIGFNPWSLVGLSWWAPGRRPGAIRSAQLLGRRRLRDWLSLLGFEVLSIDGCFHRPPVASAALLARLEPAERFGAIATPLLAGSYLILARKRVVTLTPVRPRWRERRRLVAVGLSGGAAARTGAGD